MNPDRNVSALSRRSLLKAGALASAAAAVPAGAAALRGRLSAARPATRPATKPRRERKVSFGIGVLIGVDKAVICGSCVLPKLEPAVLQVKKPRLSIAVCTVI